MRHPLPPGCDMLQLGSAARQFHSRPELRLDYSDKRRIRGYPSRRHRTGNTGRPERSSAPWRQCRAVLFVLPWRSRTTPEAKAPIKIQLVIGNPSEHQLLKLRDRLHLLERANLLLSVVAPLKICAKQHPALWCWYDAVERSSVGSIARQTCSAMPRIKKDLAAAAKLDVTTINRMEGSGSDSVRGMRGGA